MQVERRDGSQERRILTGLITDEAVVGRLASKWTKEGLFSSRWSNLVGSWCCEYFERYGKAPGKAVEGLFEAWSQDNRDKETTDLVERFLEGLSGEYESLASDSNTDYILDLAAKHFDRVKLAKLAELIQADIDSGNVEKAQLRVDGFTRVEIGGSMGVDVLHDREAIKQAFQRKADPLIVYPGALGTFFRDALERDALVSFMGPEKRGKTFWLLDVAWRAMQQGRRVAFFEVGDMSEGQIMLRFMTRACRRPLKATDPEKPLKFPLSIDHPPGSNFSTVEHEEHSYPKPLTWKEAWRACDKLTKKQQDGQSLLKLSCHPNSSLSVPGMSAIIQSWERGGWGSPDVVVVDYADVLSPPSGHQDSRDQINATWKQLRALSQSLHALVVTATQSDAGSYTTETMGMGNFSEDKRKNAHVTGMVGINQTPTEKLAGIQRLNWIALRESEITADDVVHVAGCLGVANPAIHSAF